jgi:hypothetical protein
MATWRVPVFFVRMLLFASDSSALCAVAVTVWQSAPESDFSKQFFQTLPTP